MVVRQIVFIKKPLKATCPKKKQLFLAIPASRAQKIISGV